MDVPHFFDPVGIWGITPLVRCPNSFAMLQIHSTPSDPRMSRGSCIRSPVSVDTVSARGSTTVRVHDLQANREPIYIACSFFFHSGRF
jgi:hypothetical protein